MEIDTPRHFVFTDMNGYGLSIKIYNPISSKILDDISVKDWVISSYKRFVWMIGNPERETFSSREDYIRIESNKNLKPFLILRKVHEQSSGCFKTFMDRCLAKGIIYNRGYNVYLNNQWTKGIGTPCYICSGIPTLAISTEDGLEFVTKSGIQTKEESDLYKRYVEED